MITKLRKRLYWLGAGLVLLIALFFLIPDSKDNPYMKIRSMSDGRDFSGCEFSDGKQSQGFRFRMTPEDCRLVDYGGGDVLTVSIEYPSMQVVKPRVDSGVVTIRMFRVLRNSYREGAFLEGVVPSRVIDDVKFYDYGGLVTRVFDGSDGETVFATDHERFWLAKRLYKNLRVSYQYSRKYEDLKSMDKFVMDFLGRVVAN